MSENTSDSGTYQIPIGPILINIGSGGSINGWGVTGDLPGGNTATVETAINSDGTTTTSGQVSLLGQNDFASAFIGSIDYSQTMDSNGEPLGSVKFSYDGVFSDFFQPIIDSLNDIFGPEGSGELNPIGDPIGDPIGKPLGGWPGFPYGPDDPRWPQESVPPPPLPEMPPETPASPLVLDLDGDGVETVGLDANIHFDHAGDGFKELSGFVGADDGLLVWDKNGDGQVNSGAELFGNETVLGDGTKADNGFLALADLDSNGDGVFDVNDDKFSELRVFQDKNQNGQADDGELLTLSDAGVQSISLEYSNSSTVDENGNEHRQLGSFITTSGETHSIEDVWFIRNLSDSKEALIEVSVEIAELPNAVNFGTAHSLHQAMARDETGHLQQLVQQFVGATTNEERQSLIDPIIFAWTNQGAEYSQYYQSPIDARKIGALEAFYGHDLDTPNGSGQDFATIYESIFQKVADGIYYQLAATGHLKDLFSQVNWSQNAETGTWEGNYFSVVDDFLTMVESNPEEALAKFEDFKQAVKGINAYDPVNLSLLNQSVATFIKFYKDFNFEFYSQETVDVFSLYTLGATSGDDVVTANTGMLQLYGFEGNDTLNGNSDDNTLYGGKGNDYLNGGGSYAKDSDTYHFSVGDGQDTIYDRDYYVKGTDTIYLHGVSLEDVRMTTDSQENLTIHYGEGDQITIVDYLSSSQYHIERLVFDDSTELNVSEILAKAMTGSDQDDTIYGSSLDDLIYGHNGNDTIVAQEGHNTIDAGSGDDYISAGSGYYYGNNVIEAGEGNDTVVGGEGNDTITGGKGNDYLKGSDFSSDSDDYHFSVGDGQDTIYDRDYYVKGTDTIYLHGVSLEDVRMTTDSQENLTIHYGEGDQITIVDYLSSSQYHIERLVFDDSTELNVSEILAKAMTGSDQDDTIYGSSLDDLIYGHNGNDTIVAQEGHNTIDAGSGDDYISAGSGYYYGNNVIEAGEGNDTVVGGEGNDTITGGKGNDYLKGSDFSSDSDDYHFSVGDGQDTIYDRDYYVKGTDTIYLHGVSLEDVRMTTDSQENLTIHYGEGDQITIVDYLSSSQYHIERLVFDDSTELNVSEILAKAMTGSDQDDTIYGSSLDDLIYGHNGNDTIVAQEGHNTIDAGSGDDYISAGSGYYYGNNVIDGGAGSDMITGGTGDDVITGGTGNDTLKGGRGDDVYHFTRGDGQDTIIDYSYSNSGQDTLYLHGIVSEELLYSMSSEGDFTIHIGNEDSITIVDYLTSTKNQIEQINLDDGQCLDTGVVNTVLEGFISIGSGDDAASLSLTEEQQMQFHQVILDAWEIA